MQKLPSTYSSERNIPTDVFLYNDPSAKTLVVEEIASHIRGLFPGMKVEVRRDFVSHHYDGSIEELAEKIARTKVRNISDPFESFDPLLGEMKFEEGLIAEPEKGTSGILYDAVRLHLVLREMIPEEELSLRAVHAAFTSRLFGTFDDADRRYHARVILCGYPSIISTSGIVEAPAKPREYYLMRQKLRALGEDVPAEVLKEQIQGRFLDYDDPRMTEVMKGYSLQALFYAITHEPFCEDPECRLYNSHWQEEVLASQLGDKEFCDEHASMIRRISDQ
ncbi:MAG: hypothetical protein LN417_08160 [Candidatus Thermoplasmatota archaeon]|nr:hypothetical protein [Candidatus Thermoplasmatota archaeon]